VRVLIEHLERVEALAEAHTGVVLRDMRLLEIGCGQRLSQTMYLARRNDVIGIDLDVFAQGFDVAAYLKMLRENGPVRLAKTVGRKVLGLDRALGRELKRQLGPTRRPTIMQMDAGRMSFADGSFDGVVSISVFEHLADPRTVISETVRVLRPGGVAVIGLDLYTAEAGAHDPRIFSGNRADLPLWAHMRPRYRELVQSNSFLNRLHLAEWYDLFRAAMPGVRFEHLRDDRLAPDLARLREAGELSDYTDDELLTAELLAVWRKAA
jgi:SAM-dependent methyltransferase